MERTNICPIFETVAKGDSNPGSLDCESGVLPLSYRAPLPNSPFPLKSSLRWPAARDMGQTRGLRFSHVLIDRHLIHHHTKAFFKTKPLNAYSDNLRHAPLASRNRNNHDSHF